MKTIVIILLVPFAFLKIIAHPLAPTVNNVISELQNKGVDTIAYIENHCESMVSDSCGNSVFYVLWRSNNKTFIQKMDACKKSNIKKDSTNYFFNFYILHRTDIIKEEVKHFELKNGGWQIIDHYCERKINVIIKKSLILHKKINLYYLTKGNDKDPNINYKTNNALKLVEWQQNTYDLIKNLWH